MKKLWLAAAMAVSVAALQLPASAAAVNGIPAPGPHGIHGIIIRHCRWHGHYYRRCPHRGPIGIVVGRRPIGRTVGVRPIGVETHGIGPNRPGGGLVNGITPEQRVQH
jgi:hypothetical protein